MIKYHMKFTEALLRAFSQRVQSTRVRGIFLELLPEKGEKMVRTLQRP